MENAPATNKSAKTNQSKSKKPKISSKSTKRKTTISKTSQASKLVKTNTKSTSESAGITQLQRQTMIQEMAYLIAERRGFSGGNQTDDWLTAENQVDATLLSGATKG